MAAHCGTAGGDFCRLLAGHGLKGCKAKKSDYQVLHVNAIFYKNSNFRN
jgi:hypothetical protein